MTTLTFDIETPWVGEPGQDLDPTSVETIHCIVAEDWETGEVRAFRPGEVEAGVRLLATADRLVAHNGVNFDLPVLEHLFPDLTFTDDVLDTRMASRLQYFTTLLSRSSVRRRQLEARGQDFPAHLLGNHSLEAWGYRLGFAKAHAGEGREFFEAFSEEMLERCVSDVRLCTRLAKYMLKDNAVSTLILPRRRKGESAAACRRRGRRVYSGPCSERSLVNDSQFGRVLQRQKANGVGFDDAAAERLEAHLSLREVELREKLQAQVAGWWAPNGDVVTPKRTQVLQPGTQRNPGSLPVVVEEGCAYQKIKWLDFNPGSPLHKIRLLEEHGWEPDSFTDTGQPKTDAEALRGLPYPFVPDLAEYAVVSSRLGQLCTGTRSWRQMVTPAGRIHGNQHATGTRTSRSSHFRPNMNVPKKHSPYGPEFRALFRPTRPGWVCVGADASGIELRMLAHELAGHGNEAFAKTVTEGDPHSEWQAITGLHFRDSQKTFSYAWLYGAGARRLGRVVREDWDKAAHEGLTDEAVPPITLAAELGAHRADRLLAMVPGLDSLKRATAADAARGWVVGLDGRILRCASEHGALNDRLQSAGMIVMKYATVEFDRRARAAFGSRPWGREFGYCLQIHDEWMIECPPENAEWMGENLVDSIRWAGEHLEVRCPLAGEWKAGASWADVH